MRQGKHKSWKNCDSAAGHVNFNHDQPTSHPLATYKTLPTTKERLKKRDPAVHHALDCDCCEPQLKSEHLSPNFKPRTKGKK